MRLYVYVLMLLLMFMTTAKVAVLSIRAPRKIRAAGIIVCALALLRYTALTILLTADNIIFLYVLKPFVYLQYIFIPIIAFSTIYILLKKSRFFYIFLMLAALVILYTVLILTFQADIEYIQGWGYKLDLQCQYFMDWIYLAFNLIVFFASMILVKPGKLKLVKVSSAVSLIELLLKIYCVPLLINPIAGEMFWLAAFINSLVRLKRQV